MCRIQNFGRHVTCNMACRIDRNGTVHNSPMTAIQCIPLSYFIDILSCAHVVICYWMKIFLPNIAFIVDQIYVSILCLAVLYFISSLGLKCNKGSIISEIHRKLTSSSNHQNLWITVLHPIDAKKRQRYYDHGRVRCPHPTESPGQQTTQETPLPPDILPD